MSVFWLQGFSVYTLPVKSMRAHPHFWKNHIALFAVLLGDQKHK
jgi:hypothetical protein